MLILKYKKIPIVIINLGFNEYLFLRKIGI